MAERECVFCRIPREQGAQHLYKDEKVYVIRDIHPRAPVHLLIIPLEHLTSPTDQEPSQVPVMGQMFVVAQEMARREGVALSGYRLIVNQGPDSGQEVQHIHMHLLAGRRLVAMG